MKTLTIKIPSKLLKEIEKELKIAGCSVDKFVCRAIVNFLEDLEDVRIAEERLASDEPLIPFEQVIRENGLLKE